MHNTLKRSRKVLYYTLAIACVIGILWTLYRIGFSSYSLTYKYQAKWFPEEMTAYKIYHSVFLGYVSDICFYAGLVSVFVLWKKPRPTWMFVLVITAYVLPRLVSFIIRSMIDTSTAFFQYYLDHPLMNITIILFNLSWIIAKVIVIAKLYTDSGKTEKPVLLMYFIIILIGTLVTISPLYYLFIFVFSISEQVTILVTGIINVYISYIIQITLYILTLIHLKKTLGEDMPFTKTLRMLKEQYNNKAPE